MMDLAGAVLSIVDSTLHLISEEKRTMYMKKYHQLMTEINRMENLDENDIIDSDLDNLYVELFIFVKAFNSELKESSKAVLH